MSQLIDILLREFDCLELQLKLEDQRRNTLINKYLKKCIQLARRTRAIIEDEDRRSEREQRQNETHDSFMNQITLEMYK